MIGVLFQSDGELQGIRCLILPRKVLYQKRLGYPKLKTLRYVAADYRSKDHTAKYQLGFQTNA
ncbi:MAG TPA: hypothetical protein DCS36_05130 [Sphingobacterium sp.]|nr:hypothetical protein HMPREF3127_07120 [Sphingobacterium sp. HMSC13C05]HAE68832.1 hypothetical protein [Sphingobacterium sp.]HAF37017.1 hypothetical protein [Sphingobacterium sp.]HAK29330.1 hypothetical protein [Sphingobacterium sp.]HAL51712.1 hypothetical protein [Sphingobacterium sp.]